MIARLADRRPPDALAAALSACRRDFWAVGLFSGVVNLLQLTVSIYMLQLFDRVYATRSADTLWLLTLIAVAALLLLAILEACRGMVMARVGAWVEARVAPEGFLRGIEAELRGRPYRMEALRDLGQLRGWISSPAALAVYDVPWVPIYLGVIFLLHAWLGWLALVGAAALFLLTLATEWLTAPLLRDAGSRMLAAQRRAEATARNAEVIDSMGMQRPLLAAWQDSLLRAAEPARLAADRAAVLLALGRFARLALQIAILGLGAWLVLRQELTPGASIAASIIMGRALAPVEQLIAGFKQLVAARAARRRLELFLAQPRLRPEGKPLPEPTGRLAAERVVFAFPQAPGTAPTMPVIKGVSFALDPGESLAIVGPSAAGKTTLLRLITGTLAPSSGTVRLDGADVHLWQREDFGRHIGYLPQDVELFEGTVFDNIARMGEAAPEAVYDAARLAGCHEMILRLPQGYETQIGEGGQHLSGGQRQMIGLARALFGTPKLVVLDEPNSNLDGDAEQRLVASLRDIKRRGATVVVVSHRPALVQVVDKVLLLKDGAAEMFGPRAEVLKRLMPPPRIASAQGPQGDAA
jgi:ATP-binding cassette subfamily C protein/ATP-binding cassette subfamily C protein EexD